MSIFEMNKWHIFNNFACQLIETEILTMLIRVKYWLHILAQDHLFLGREINYMGPSASLTW